MLDPSSYPLYIADKDGISHTTLLVSCLRKLQGWTPESILDEIARFEPDHEDLPLVPFITSYLATGPSTDSLVLPSPPLPSWLWPTIASSTTSTDKNGSTTAPSSASASPGMTLSRSNTSLNKEAREREPSAPRERDKEKEKERDRERTLSAPAVGSLPFPHPLSSRKHPTMKLTFPPLPSTNMGPPPVPDSASGKTGTTPTNPSFGLSRVNSRRDTRSGTVGTREDEQSMMAAATSILSATLVTLGIGVEEKRTGEEGGGAGASGSALTVRDGTKREGLSAAGEPANASRAVSAGKPPGLVSRTVSWEKSGVSAGILERDVQDVGGRSMPSKASTGGSSSDASEAAREVEGGQLVALGEMQDAAGGGAQSGSSPESSAEDSETETEQEEEEDEEDDEDEDEDEDDDDDGEMSLQPTSLHISALDLAGYG